MLDQVLLQQEYGKRDIDSAIPGNDIDISNANKTEEHYDRLSSFITPDKIAFISGIPEPLYDSSYQIRLSYLDIIGGYIYIIINSNTGSSGCNL